MSVSATRAPCAFPSGPSRDSEAASGVLASKQLTARETERETTDSTPEKPPRRPTFIIRRTGRRGVSSLPTGAQRKRFPLDFASGTFVSCSRSWLVPGPVRKGLRGAD